MSRLRQVLLVCCTLTLTNLITAVQAEEISSASIDAVSRATFEVVLLKPTEDTLTYERPLPLDLIPFSIRNDLYYSVGTAFAINKDQWVTAAHVLGLGSKSLSKTYRLRDKSGKVYDIDKILKYSHQRDFVVFTIKDSPDIQPLVINTTPRTNEKVYAVGNALGEGIVFRDGLYTSSTPEDQDGLWNWIRFSAAASPGNSGGPLLDLHGKAIGVVMRKSEGENLNYALPMTEILAAEDNVAVLDIKMIYRIENMANLSTMDRLSKKIPLPKTYAELDEQLTADIYNFSVRLQSKFFAQESERVFPKGKQSLPLLNTNYNSKGVPGIIAISEDGMWDVFFPKETNRFDLGHNGSLNRGSIGGSEAVSIYKPDDVELGALYKDSKLMMDLILRGLPLHRTIGAENIKITSLGKAKEEYVYTDHYERKWLVRVWNINFSDEQIAVFALPAPGGFKGFVRVTKTEEMPGHIDDLKALTDFIYTSYYGTLKDWKIFFAQGDLLPRALANIKLDFEYGKHFRYTSKRLTFTYDPNEMHITEQSDLKIRFAYFMENNKAEWDATSIRVGDDKNNEVVYELMRYSQPVAELDNTFKSDWDKIVQRQYPYNKTVSLADSITTIGDVASAGLPEQQAGPARLLYTVFYRADGVLAQKDAEAKLSSFMGKLKIIEN